MTAGLLGLIGWLVFGEWMPAFSALFLTTIFVDSKRSYEAFDDAGLRKDMGLSKLVKFTWLLGFDPITTYLYR